MQDAIFQVQHFSLAYPARRGHPAVTILDGISVDVERGSASTLVGHTGTDTALVQQRIRDAIRRQRANWPASSRSAQARC